MTHKIVIFMVVLTWPISILAQEVSGTEPASKPSSAAPDGEPAPDMTLEPSSAEPEGGALTEVTSEQVGNEPEGKPTEVPIIISDDDTLSVRLGKGHRLFMQSNYQGALSVYKSATAMAPAAAESYLFVSYTLGKLDRYDDAMVALAAVTTVVEDEDESIRARGLFIQTVIEEMRGPSEAVKEGWTAYEKYAQAHDDAVTFASTATARLVALARMQELDEKYQIVRERIAKNNQ